MKKFVGFTLAAMLLFTASAYGAQLPADVQNCDEIHVINTFFEYGAAQVEDDGRFHPDRYITVGEAARITKNLAEKTAPPAEDRLFATSLLSGNFQSAAEKGGLYICAAKLERENPDETAYLTRNKLAEAIYEYMRTLDSFDNSTYYLPDVPASNLAVGYVRAKGIMYPKGNGLFCPDSYVTKAEFCNAMYAISGLPLIYASNNLPASAVLDTPYVSQLSPVYAVVGCEGASLLMGLKAKGYAQNVDLREFLDNMPKHESNPAKGYVGSPYVAHQEGKRTTIYPAPLAQYACAYGKVRDFSGSSVKEIQAELLSGNPVVIYATMWWKEPKYVEYNIEGETQSLLRNNHVVLADGYDSVTRMYHISDPYNDKDTSEEYKYWIDAATFEYCYNIRRHCIVVE